MLRRSSSNPDIKQPAAVSRRAESAVFDDSMDDFSGFDAVEEWAKLKPVLLERSENLIQKLQERLFLNNTININQINDDLIKSDSFKHANAKSFPNALTYLYSDSFTPSIDFAVNRPRVYGGLIAAFSGQELDKKFKKDVVYSDTASNAQREAIILYAAFWSLQSDLLKEEVNLLKKIQAWYINKNEKPPAEIGEIGFPITSGKMLHDKIGLFTPLLNQITMVMLVKDEMIRNIQKAIQEKTARILSLELNASIQAMVGEKFSMLSYDVQDEICDHLQIYREDCEANYKTDELFWKALDLLKPEDCIASEVIGSVLQETRNVPRPSEIQKQVEPEHIEVREAKQTSDIDGNQSIINPPPMHVAAAVPARSERLDEVEENSSEMVDDEKGAETDIEVTTMINGFETIDKGKLLDDQAYQKFKDIVTATMKYVDACQNGEIKMNFLKESIFFRKYYINKRKEQSAILEELLSAKELDHCIAVLNQYHLNPVVKESKTMREAFASLRATLLVGVIQEASDSSGELLDGIVQQASNARKSK